MSSDEVLSSFDKFEMNYRTFGLQPLKETPAKYAVIDTTTNEPVKLTFDQMLVESKDALHKGQRESFLSYFLNMQRYGTGLTEKELLVMLDKGQSDDERIEFVKHVDTYGRITYTINVRQIEENN